MMKIVKIIAKKITRITNSGTEEFINIQALSLEGEVVKDFTWDGSIDGLHMELDGLSVDGGVDRVFEEMQSANYQMPTRRRYLLAKPGIYNIEGSTVWVIGGRAFNNSDLFDVEVSSSEFDWRAGADSDDWQISVQKICQAAQGAGAMLFSALLVAIMKPLFVMLDLVPDFTVNVWGKSASGKTKMLKALTGVLEVGSNNKMKFSVHSAKEILATFTACYGFPLLIDDYHPQKSSNSRQKQEGLLDLIIRTGDDNPETAMLFITSEMLGGTYSTQDRMLQIHIPEQSTENICSFAQACNVVPSICQEFLQRLTENMDEAKDMVRNGFADRKNLSGRLDWIHRFLTIAARLFDMYISRGIYSVESQMQETLDLQGEMQRRHMKSIDETGKCVRPFMIVEDMIHIHKVFKITDYSPVFPNEIKIAKNGDLIVRRIALQYGIDELGLSASLKINELVNALSEYEILVEESSTHTTKFEGVRIYRLKADRLRLISRYFYNH